MKWKYYLYLTLFMPVAVLPFWALYLLSDGLYLLFYKVLRYRLHVVRQNLSMAFPEKTEAERRAIEKEFYRQFWGTTAIGSGCLQARARMPFPN